MSTIFKCCCCKSRADGVCTNRVFADGRGSPSKGEQAQWTRQYLACAAELSQWEVVAEYASVTENYAQMADCLWRLHDWMRLKDLVLPKAMVPPSPAATGPVRVASACHSIVEERTWPLVPCRMWLEQPRTHVCHCRAALRSLSCTECLPPEVCSACKSEVLPTAPLGSCQIDK